MKKFSGHENKLNKFILYKPNKRNSDTVSNSQFSEMLVNFSETCVSKTENKY